MSYITQVLLWYLGPCDNNIQSSQIAITTNRYSDNNYLSFIRLAIVKHTFLPYLACQFVTENSIVAAGYDNCPVLWSHDDQGKLTYINKLDQTEKKTTGYVRWGGPSASSSQIEQGVQCLSKHLLELRGWLVSYTLTSTI